MFLYLVVVGGPLRFLDLEDSFFETEQKLTEILLSMLQQELGDYCFVSCFPFFYSRNFINQGLHQVQK